MVTTNDSSSGLIKIVFLSILLIALLTFCGGLAMADTGLFNWRMQEAEAGALEAETRTEEWYDAIRAPYFEEELRQKARLAELQIELQIRALAAEHNRTQSFRETMNTIILVGVATAVLATVLLGTYFIFCLIRQAFERQAPRRPGRMSSGVGAPPPSPRSPRRTDTQTATPRTADRSASTQPGRQPAYLCRHERANDPVIIVQDNNSYPLQNGHSSNGYNR